MNRKTETKPHVVTACKSVRVGNHFIAKGGRAKVELTEHQVNTLEKSGHIVNTPEKQAQLDKIEADAEAAKQKALADADAKSKSAKSK